MIDRTLARGLFLAAIALAFGLGAMNYNFGSFSRAGPGLFPLMVSAMLGVVAVATIIRSRFMPKEPLHFNVNNISLLLLALCTFALTSKFVNMSLGVVAMVFVAGLAGSAKYSVWRNLKVSAALLAVAFTFQKFLGLNLNLY